MFSIFVKEIKSKHSFLFRKQDLLTVRLPNNLVKVIMSSQLLGPKSVKWMETKNF